MLERFFSSKPLIEQTSKQWLEDCFVWASKHFDHQFFLNQSQVVLPTNEFYPGRVSSTSEMAQSLFDKTVAYCGMTKWPLKLVSQQQVEKKGLPQLSFLNTSRESGLSYNNNQITNIQVIYNPAQINQPQDMIASFVQQLANILIIYQIDQPPGGDEFKPQAIDFLSIYLGFGVLFANTAYQFKGGCGSCYNPNANRQAMLPEHEVLYALALFCVVKSQPAKEVARHLKGHLRGNFKKMVKAINREVNTDHQHLLLPLMSE